MIMNNCVLGSFLSKYPQLKVNTRMQAIKLVLAFLVLNTLPTSIYSHAIVFPNESTVSSWEKYVLRVPNERGVPTIGVELTFPAGLKVMSFADVAGWKLTVHKDSAGLPIAAEWRGNLGIDRFVEFPFVAVNPDTALVLNWPTTQEYAGGELVHWTGAANSETPVSATSISAPVPEVVDTTTPTEVDTEDEDEACKMYTCYAAWAALAVAVAALVLASIKRKQKS